MQGYRPLTFLLNSIVDGLGKLISTGVDLIFNKAESIFASVHF